MHVYIYDSFLSQKKFESILAKIETRITDLGLSGKIIRLGTMNSIYNTIEDELKKNAKTIVVVGNINILNQAVNAFASFSHDKQTFYTTPLGFIPIGKKDNEVAKILGVPTEEEACNVLSARRIKTIDLGLANEKYFLTDASISTEKTSVEIDTNYSIEITEKGEIAVVNMVTDFSLPAESESKVDDGVLELFIKTKKNKTFIPLKEGKQNNSVFSFKKLIISNPESGVIIDKTTTVPTPVLITIAEEKLNLIVGKSRFF